MGYKGLCVGKGGHDGGALEEADVLCAGVLLLRAVVRLVPGSLIEFSEGISKTVTEIRQVTVLLLEDGAFDDGSPDRAVLLVASFENTVFFFGKGTTLLAGCLSKMKRPSGRVERTWRGVSLRWSSTPCTRRGSTRCESCRRV